MSRISLVVDCCRDFDLVDFYECVKDPLMDLGAQLQSTPGIEKCVLVFEEVI